MSRFIKNIFFALYFVLGLSFAYSPVLNAGANNLGQEGFVNAAGHEMVHAVDTNTDPDARENFAKVVGEGTWDALDNGLFMSRADYGMETTDYNPDFADNVMMTLNGYKAGVIAEGDKEYLFEPGLSYGLTPEQLSDQKFITDLYSGQNKFTVKSLEVIGAVDESLSELTGSLLKNASDKSLTAFMVYNGLKTSSEVVGFVQDKSFDALAYGFDNVTGEDGGFEKFVGEELDRIILQWEGDPYLAKKGAKALFVTTTSAVVAPLFAETALGRKLGLSGDTASSGSKGVGLVDDDFVHVTTKRGKENILKKGMDPEISSSVTKYKHVKKSIEQGNPKIFNTKMYKQELWNKPEIKNKFDSGAEILKINPKTKPKYYSPRTNVKNGVPEWRIQESVAPKDIEAVKTVVPKK